MDWQDDNLLDYFTNITEVKIFSEILKSCNKNNLHWSHTSSIRKEICLKLEISEICFKVRINVMHKNKILIKKERGLYCINEKLVIFGR